MKTLLLRVGMVVVVVALVVGAWQVAYARGRDQGLTEVTAIRNEFVQSRQGGQAGNGAGGPGGAAAKPGQQGAGQGGQGGGQGGAAAKPGGAGGAGRQGVNGTVEKVEDNVVTIATNDGSVQVTMSDQTRINKQVAGTPADLKAGEHVFVFGERKSDKEYTASAIQIGQVGQGR